MKSAKASLAGALDRPVAEIRFYLFYGPDEAGSRALAMRLLRGLGNAEKFILIGAAVKSDPAMLADEAGAMTLFGGARALWIEPAGEEIVDGVSALLASPASESAVIAMAGALRKTSGLLKLAEAHPAALAHCSYVPEGRQMDELVVALGREVGLRVSPDMAQRLAAAANHNQAIIASELEKFSLYVGAGPDRLCELYHETVDLLLADAAESDLLKLGDLALAGRMDRLVIELEQLRGGGSDTVPILRATQRRLLMLAPLRARLERGETLDGVMASLGKALFWKDKAVVQQMVGRWSAAQIAQAASRVAALERELMRARPPAEASLGETLITFARVGRRQ